MGMKPSEKVLADIQALAASAGATKSVFQQLSATDLDVLAQIPSTERRQALRKALTQAVLGSLDESGRYLRASTSGKVVSEARVDSTADGRGVIPDSTFGYVSKSNTDASAMMEAIRQREPKLFSAIVARIDDSAANMAALQRLSKANFEMRGKDIFDGNITASQIREWVAGNAKTAEPIPIDAPPFKASAPKA